LAGRSVAVDADLIVLSAQGGAPDAEAALPSAKRLPFAHSRWAPAARAWRLPIGISLLLAFAFSAGIWALIWIGLRAVHIHLG